jgi:hypothetical protein
MFPHVQLHTENVGVVSNLRHIFKKKKLKQREK